MTLSIGFSPCPNDTYIFDALVHNRIDTEGLNFKVELGDVEELNLRAFERSLDVTKISYHALAFLREHYALLSAGSALGKGVGPLVVAKEPLDLANQPDLRIAIPGKYTTANFLLRLAYPNLAEGIPTLFSEIEEAVLNGEADAGLLIHENRFTYADRGLVCLDDLGSFWEENYHQPIPLGGIVIARDLPQEIQQKMERVLSRSVAYAMKHPEASRQFVAQHAQAMDAEVRRKHIALYVNDFSLDLGAEGILAVKTLFEEAERKGIIPACQKPLMV